MSSFQRDCGVHHILLCGAGMSGINWSTRPKELMPAVTKSAAKSVIISARLNGRINGRSAFRRSWNTDTSTRNAISRPKAICSTRRAWGESRSASR